MGLARYIVPPSGAKGRDVRELHGRVGRELRGKGATETIAHSKPELRPFCMTQYRADKKGWYVVARYFILALLSFSAWPCLAVA